MNRFHRLLVAALLAVTTAGCGRYYEFGQANTSGRGRGELAFLAPVYSPGWGSGLALVSTAEPVPEPERIYVNNVYYVNGSSPARPAPQRPSAEREAVADLPSFDPHAARQSLDGIDVSSCAVAGAKRGFGHAKVTMSPDGRITKVIVDEPSGLSDDAAKCIGERLGTATIRPFKGNLVTVGTTYYVR
jgi:hypothetical protein